MNQPSFLERIMSRDGSGMPGAKALELQAIVKAERKLIAAIRKALKEYDRYVKPDGRNKNGRKRVDPMAVRKGRVLVLSGVSIREAAKRVGISFGTLWKAMQKHYQQSNP